MSLITFIATVGNSGNNANDYAGHEFNSSSHNETKQDFSNYSNNSTIADRSIAEMHH